MSKTIELPEDVYEALIRAAQENGTTPAAWIARTLPRRPGRPTEEERQAASLRLRQHTISLGYPTGSDNESIDADLAREYGDDHADLYHPNGDP